MRTEYLLDTCAVIWAANGDELSDEAVSAIDQSANIGKSVFISVATAWEVGLLVSRGRIRLPMPANDWFRAVSEQNSVKLCHLSPEILIRSTELPGTPPNDPADRMIIATARHSDLSIITRDRKILAYAKEGHVRALTC